MEIGTNPDYGKAWSAALDWWREAGVGNAFHDEARSWLPQAATPAKSRSLPSVSPDQAPDQDSAATVALSTGPIPPPVALPATLDLFRSWWLSTPTLDNGRIMGRVAPRGDASADLMIISAMPESGDQERLLAGPEGKLLDLFLAQAGVAQNAVYHASALPCHSPAADWGTGGTQMLGEALRHHILLARPKRLLVVGFNLLPLLQHGSTQGPAVSGIFNHEDATVPMLAVRRIPVVASQPRWKCILWQAWLDWTA